MPSWPPYDSTLRRRARAALRLSAAVASPRFYPRAPVVPAYWWDGHANFGDALTPWLLHRYRMIAVHTSPSSAAMSGAGSIIEQLSDEFAGTVWGSGLMYGEKVALPHATFAAVRGQHTREVLGLAGDVALGDPGLLVSRHLTRPRVRYALGLVPHGLHNSSETIARLAADRSDVTVIDTRGTVSSVVRQIARCEAIVSSSLHGLIVADSYGIPAAWCVLDPPLWGAEFKFHDHESVVTSGSSRRVIVDETATLPELRNGLRAADPDLVKASIESVEAALSQVRSTSLPPYLALRAR